MYRCLKNTSGLSKGWIHCCFSYFKLKMGFKTKTYSQAKAESITEKCSLTSIYKTAVCFKAHFRHSLGTVYARFGHGVCTVWARCMHGFGTALAQSRHALGTVKAQLKHRFRVMARFVVRRRWSNLINLV